MHKVLPNIITPRPGVFVSNEKSVKPKNTVDVKRFEELESEVNQIKSILSKILEKVS